MRKFYFKLAGMIAMLSIATLSHAQWEQLSLEKANGDTLKNIKCITKHGGAIYIGTSDSAVWVSNSGVGGDWIPYGSPNNINVTSIAVGTNVSAIRGDDSLQILEAGNWTKKQYSGSNFKVGKVVLQESTGKLFAPQ